MKKRFTLFAIALLTLLSGCQIAGGIFKAGVWVGVIIIAAVIILIFFLISKTRKRD